tara:strand:+ start:4366 stop:5136 length:771 start_codon:yes stop_codon:yes gene_type:complete
MKVPDLEVKKTLYVGEGDPSMVLGKGPLQIRGGSFIEGPMVVGDMPPFLTATVMIGPASNADITLPPIIPGALCTGINNPYSLAVEGPAAFLGVVDAAQNINAGGDITAQGEVKSRCGVHILSAKKNFDIPHPTKEGWRLRHTCPEGPTNDVYIRGKLKNHNIIDLPDYWRELVDPESITVSITPVGSNNNIMIHAIEDNKVVLHSTRPINCHYLVFGERMDGERLISEYEGSTPADYPGNNDEYSVSGYHYDKKR